MKHWKIVK